MTVEQLDTSILIEDPSNRKVGGVDIIQSVGTLGVLQPILVAKDGDKYKIIAGARRVASAKHFGIPVVPAIVLQSEDVQIQAAENFDRKNLNPIDESDMILALKKKGMNREVIASWMNISVQQVARREKLGQLSAKMKNLVKSGQVSAAVASEFVLVSKEKQDEFLSGYDGRDISIISQSQARNKARWIGGRQLRDCVPDLLLMIDIKGESCKTCPKCEGSDDKTLFEESEEKVCYDAECFRRRLCEYVKRYKVPFLSDDAQLNEISETTLDESWEKIWAYQRAAFAEVVEGIDDSGKPALYGRGKATNTVISEDSTKPARKLFGSHIKEMNEILTSIEKLTGEALEAFYTGTHEIDCLALQVLRRNYLSEAYQYDGVAPWTLSQEESPDKAKVFAKAMLIALVGEPVRWKKAVPFQWPVPPHRDNPLIQLASRYVKKWSNHELRLKYLKLWEQYVLEQWRAGNENMEPLLIQAGNVNKETWK